MFWVSVYTMHLCSGIVDIFSFIACFFLPTECWSNAFQNKQKCCFLRQSSQLSYHLHVKLKDETTIPVGEVCLSVLNQVGYLGVPGSAQFVVTLDNSAKLDTTLMSCNGLGSSGLCRALPSSIVKITIFAYDCFFFLLNNLPSLRPVTGLEDME